MSKNPFINGLSASLYIVLVASFMRWGSTKAPHPDTFVAPIAFISVFTLSAAVMGYLFCYQPIQLYFDGKKKQGANLFLHTLGVFALLTFVVLGLLFAGV